MPIGRKKVKWTAGSAISKPVTLTTDRTLCAIIVPVELDGKALYLEANCSIHEDEPWARLQRTGQWAADYKVTLPQGRTQCVWLPFNYETVKGGRKIRFVSDVPQTQAVEAVVVQINKDRR